MAKANNNVVPAQQHSNRVTESFSNFLDVLPAGSLAVSKTVKLAPEAVNTTNKVIALGLANANVALDKQAEEQSPEVKAELDRLMAI